jgi:hypothetical protein
MTVELSPEKDVTEGLATVSYAVNSKGNVELVPGSGWQPVNVVNAQAWREIEKKISAAKKKVLSGRASCLQYYMIANQMNAGLLAKYTKQPYWRVRLHLIPFFFSRLSPDIIGKYAELFQVSAVDLTSGALKPPVYEYKNNQPPCHG